MADSSIEWCDKVWNVVRGCSRVSPGCGGSAGEGGCYAEKQAYRFSGESMPYEGLVRLGKHGPRWTGRLRFVTEKLDEPARWRKPQRIFVNSMSDLFHEELTNEQIAAVFGVMAQCPQHTFMALTKRASRMREWFKWVAGNGDEFAPPSDFVATTCAVNHGAEIDQIVRPWPLPNVWLGVSAENQEYADERIPDLLATPAAVRFVSYEPALGPIDFTRIEVDDGCVVDSLRPDSIWWRRGLDWIIVGSESGPGARTMDVAWARSTVDRCLDAKVAVFTKQIATPEGRAAGFPKGGDPAYWPAGTWPREFPSVIPFE